MLILNGVLVCRHLTLTAFSAVISILNLNKADFGPSFSFFYSFNSILFRPTPPTHNWRAGYSNLWGYATNREAGALTVVERGIDARAGEVEAAGIGGTEDSR